MSTSRKCNNKLNFSWITDRLAFGSGFSGPADISVLVNVGITHIMDVEINDDRPYMKNFPQVVYAYNGIEDDHKDKPIEYWKNVIEFSLGALSRPNTKVYIHCAAGVSRSAGAVYTVLRAMGIKADDTLALIQKYRPQAHPEFWTQWAEFALKKLGYV